MKLFDSIFLVAGPMNFSMDDKTYTTISISWNEPEERNGPITFYKITWEKLNQAKNSWIESTTDMTSSNDMMSFTDQPDLDNFTAIVNSTIFSFNATNLEPGESYRFYISAINEIGNGENAIDIFSTWTGGKINHQCRS